MPRMMRLPVGTLAALLGLAAVAPGAQAPARFEMQKIADGVYAAIRTEPPGLMFDANSIFLIGPDDVIVVDTNVTPSSAGATLAALRQLTDKPVSTVINTHWHDDHVIGNHTFREAFPNARFVGHTTSPRDMLRIGAANRKQRFEFGPQLVQQLRLSLELRRSMAGGDLTDEERRSYQSDIDAAERFFTEAPGVPAVTPTVTVADRLALTQGARTIEVRHLGAGHTPADLVVHLPRERIAIAGDLVAAPVPLVGSTSRPAAFAATLAALLALKPAIIVPGHGPVMRDEGYVRRQARLLRSLVAQVRNAAAPGATLPEVRKRVDLAPFRREFAGGSPLLGFLFDFQVTNPGIAAAFREVQSR
jgi:glyoxylase-like metal-dependent hydrolase (beta-lactamase superfamily II)